MKKKKPEDSRLWYRYQFFGNATVSLLKEDKVLNATIANISLSGLGLYSTVPVGKGKKVKISISYVDRNGRVREDEATGKVDWQKKFLNMYLVGIKFEEELTTANQPHLLDHLTYLIDTYNWPQPYKDKRIAML
jgi:hypothetical protein